MAESMPKILEGIFAINKPPHLSSAQVIRDLQSHFTPSSLFAPLMEQQRQSSLGDRKRRRGNAKDEIKIGHGGTLDPLATGVLIVAVGKGTKHLFNFLGCRKTYETVVLFGKSTDTYDVAGKVVASAPHEHLTREAVAEKLAQFRGKIQQVPPIYSALKINGMKAYEYARSGKELPRQLESREMEVNECEILEWYNGGEHEYRWPAEEAPEEDKRVAARLMDRVEASNQPSGEASSLKRKKPPTENRNPAKHQKTDSTQAESSEPLSNSLAPSASPPISDTASHDLPPAEKALLHIHHLPAQSSTPSPAPAAKIRLTVSSGFYVRSFAHDLGIACSSLGIMASLVRSRQADFDADDALTYADLGAGEESWAPKVEGMLDRWNEQQRSRDDSNGRRADDADGSGPWWGNGGKSQGRGFAKRFGGGGGNKDRRGGNPDRNGRQAQRGRRNTSSAED